MTATEPVMIGGEVLAGSDLHSARRPPAGGALVARLAVLAGQRGRVLVAGPHDGAVPGALRDAGAVVTCLLRGRADARERAAQGYDVRCGTLPKLAAESEYDAVVALDGLGRLCSAEGPQLTWAECLRALRRTLRPGGVLLVAVENELGVHRLVELPRPDSDSDAGPDLAELDSRPGSPSRFARLLTAEELTVDRLYAAWPLPAAPTVLAEPGVVGVTGHVLAAAVAAAFAAAYAARPVLTDPRRLGATAVRAGLGAAYAPAWVAVARHEPARGPVPPPVLLADHGAVRELDHDDAGGWFCRGPGGPVRVLPGGVTRDPTLLDGPVPGGRLMEELLLTACLRHDLTAVRRLLTGWTGWLPESGGAPFATFDNVLVDGDRYAVLDPSWALEPGVAVPVAAGRALRRFATTLLLGGYPHPWPTASDVDALTAILAAVAGVRHDPTAADLEVRIAVARTGADPDAVAAEVRRPGLATPVLGPDAWTDREMTAWRLDQHLSHERARADFAEQELAARAAELRRLRLLAATFAGSPGYRLLRLGRAAARRARRLLTPTPR